VKDVISFGKRAVDAIGPFINKPTVWNGIAGLVALSKEIVDDFEVWSEQYFDSSNWIQLYNNDFVSLIVPILTRFPVTSQVLSDEGVELKFVHICDGRVCIVYDMKLKQVRRLYVESEHVDQIKDVIKSLLWKQHKNASIVMRISATIVNYSSCGEGTVSFLRDATIKAHPSKKATEYSSYLKKCIDANVPRSALLYGPPGTGKSTMAKTIVENLGLKSIRIHVDDIMSSKMLTIKEAIDIFKPDAIIIDDFDRMSGQSVILEMLEMFREHVKLVLATANKRSMLDEAVLRPGRFDELIFVDKMDEGVVRHMLGEYEREFDNVKDWPIAFINEYVRRRAFMSSDEAAVTMRELAERVSRLDSYSDSSDVEVMKRAMLLNENKKKVMNVHEMLDTITVSK
jgi:DNA replication protein DnaC